MSELINNSQEKIDRLKTVIRGLHDGEAVEAVKERLRSLVAETTSQEIVAMEQQLIDEGMATTEVKRMCDLHSQVMREVLASELPADLPAGHPVAVLRQENRAVEGAVQRMRQAIGAVHTPALPALPPEVLQNWRAALDELLEIDKHYARKENLLFPRLEQRGVEGPSQVMWAKDDDIRELLKALREALAEEQAGIEEWRIVADQLARPLCDQVEEMIFKEERILLPMSLDKLTQAEWAGIAAETARFGTCLIDAPPAFVSSDDGGAADPGAELQGQIAFSAGALSPAQLRGMLGVLPLDLTFVDADDRVVFFTEGERVFPRPKAVIGRKVQMCHPPKSVDVVERILDDFKAGRHDAANFWIEMHGRFIQIRYFAVRDNDGSYLGTLELSQDLTPLRALQGERRLLAYGDEVPQ